MQETVYYEQDKVKVTSTRFEIRGKTFPMAQIVSVEVGERVRHPPLAYCTALVGVLGVIRAGFSFFGHLMMLEVAGMIGATFSILLFGGLVWWAYPMIDGKPFYSLDITTPAGTRSFLSSKDPTRPREVTEALIRALAERG